MLNGTVRPGDDLYTAALSPLILIPASFRGRFNRPRMIPTIGMRWRFLCLQMWSSVVAAQIVMQASRNGYFFVLDRTNGKNLLTDQLRSGQLDARSSIKTAARFQIPRKNLRQMDG